MNTCLTKTAVKIVTNQMKRQYNYTQWLLSNNRLKELRYLLRDNERYSAAISISYPPTPIYVGIYVGNHSQSLIAHTKYIDECIQHQILIHHLAISTNTVRAIIGFNHRFIWISHEFHQRLIWPNPIKWIANYQLIKNISGPSEMDH